MVGLIQCYYQHMPFLVSFECPGVHQCLSLLISQKSNVSQTRVSSVTVEVPSNCFLASFVESYHLQVQFKPLAKGSVESLR